MNDIFKQFEELKGADLHEAEMLKRQEARIRAHIHAPVPPATPLSSTLIGAVVITLIAGILIFVVGKDSAPIMPVVTSSPQVSASSTPVASTSSSPLPTESTTPRPTHSVSPTPTSTPTRTPTPTPTPTQTLLPPDEPAHTSPTPGPAANF